MKKYLTLFTLIIWANMVVFAQIPSNFHSASAVKTFLSKNPSFRISSSLVATVSYENGMFSIYVGKNELGRLDFPDEAQTFPSQRAVFGIPWLYGYAPMTIELNNGNPIMALYAVQGAENLSFNTRGQLRYGQTGRTNWMKLDLSSEGIGFDPSYSSNPGPTKYSFIKFNDHNPEEEARITEEKRQAEIARKRREEQERIAAQKQAEYQENVMPILKARREKFDVMLDSIANLEHFKNYCNPNNPFFIALTDLCKKISYTPTEKLFDYYLFKRDKDNLYAKSSRDGNHNFIRIMGKNEWTKLYKEFWNILSLYCDEVKDVGDADIINPIGKNYRIKNKYRFPNIQIAFIELERMIKRKAMSFTIMNARYTRNNVVHGIAQGWLEPCSKRMNLLTEEHKYQQINKSIGNMRSAYLANYLSEIQKELPTLHPQTNAEDKQSEIQYFNQNIENRLGYNTEQFQYKPISTNANSDAKVGIEVELRPEVYMKSNLTILNDWDLIKIRYYENGFKSEFVLNLPFLQYEVGKNKPFYEIDAKKYVTGIRFGQKKNSDIGIYY